MRPLAAAIVATLAWTGCGPTPERWMPVHRLVDATYREGAESLPSHLITSLPTAFPATAPSTAGIPTASIANDIRPVLATHPDTVIHLHSVPRPPDGRVTVNLPLERSFSAGTRVWIEPSFSVGRWIDLPPSQARVLAGFTPVDVKLEKQGRAKSAHVAVRAYRIPESPRTLHQSPPLDIPPAARLRFALGVLAPARSQGPVHFRVEACQDRECAPLFEETVDPGAAPGEGWLERVVSLEAVSGRRSLRFETEYRGPAEVGFSLPVWANPTVLARASEEPFGPNLVLLSIDTLRADHLGLYGYRRATSPFLDHLAASGTAFDAYAAAATTTGPSHMTMFTSLPPMVHGANRRLDPLAVPATLLAEVLRGSGFTTGAFTENGPIAHSRGFGRGFDEFVENKSPIYLRPRGQVVNVFAQARRFMENRGDERFFLFLHTFQVHSPYHPPPEYRELFAEETLDREKASGRDGRTVQDLVTDYDREIRYVDDQLRELYGWMRERGLDDSTLVVVTSDHGEQFYEHGCGGHECPPYRELAYVPLILHGPGVPAGHRVASPVGHIDLMPTLLELMDVPTPAHVRGVSFASTATGASRATIPARPIFTSGWDGTGASEAPYLALRQGDRMLLRIPSSRGDLYRLYDLAVDPGETRNVGIGGDRAADLLQAMRHYESESRALREQLRGASPEAPTEQAPFDPEREEQLRSLGYIE